jgi:hypothetical protein
MLYTTIPFILVGNSTKALLDDAASVGKPDLHFLAKEHNAAGVIEGLRHFRANQKKLQCLN